MGVVENALEKYGLPSDAAGACRICLTGKKRMSIENCRGVLECNCECIVVDCKKERVRIGGENLYIIAMKKEGLIIGGNILSLELE
ncbi:MAG: hypothetical protein E7420_02545 [Ruminococcaceae bacterium]|nr:hypothetical protein [Oscillospiraceae bacterium]